MGKYKPGYYAVLVGRKKGIYQTWEECKTQVCKFPNAKYKKFYDLKQAQNYVEGKKETIEIDIRKCQVWTDGSSFDNGSKDARAGIGVYWGFKDKRNLSERLPGKEQTNNRAEIYAVIRALETCEDKKNRLEIMTDSKYVINAMNEWVKKWEKNGWLTYRKEPVKNNDLFKILKRLIDNRIGTVNFVHVKGHAGNYGNEQADRLAKEGSIKEKIKINEIVTDKKITDFFKN
jgi:ribonuclease HI